MKLKSFLLLLLILISAIGISVAVYLNRTTRYENYYNGPSDEPLVAPALKGAADGVYPWSEEKSDSKQSTQVAKADDNDTQVSADDVKEKVDGQTDNQTDSGDSEAVEEVPKTFSQVTDDYFNDAVFIGDSRMLGLSMYCEPLDSRAKFFAKKSLTIYDIQNDEWVETEDGRKLTTFDALSEVEFSKVYIMVGINEIGTRDGESFAAAYKDVIDRILAINPNAIVYINSIMHVSKEKSESDELYNNANINSRNMALIPLVDGQRIFFLNVNDILDDEEGNLKAELTGDGIHLKGPYYELWHQYILFNAIQ